ncbi:hypothetical protein BDW74DRAFT_183116 [Aspergillus multicolor]|uniref:uncharacterized protein n=1 Tax=Aspergillus multicolor TaxID=41759 RepID=UPI003CCE36D3
MGIPPLSKLNTPRPFYPLITLSLTFLLFLLLTGAYHQYPRIQGTICRCQTTPATNPNNPIPTANANPNPDANLALDRGAKTTIQTFFPDNPSANSTLLSNARLTANGGFFMIQVQDGTEPNTDTEGKGKAKAKAHGYGVSMLHQSHCVDMLRAALFEPGPPGAHHHGSHPPLKRPSLSRRDGLRDADSLDAEHLGHCLDYIAQGIVCCADDTLEPRVIDAERKVAVVNGMGVAHRCRDGRGVLDAVRVSQAEPVRLGKEIVGGETVRGVLGLEDEDGVERYV